MIPLLTAETHDEMVAAKRAGRSTLDCSLDLRRTTSTIELRPAEWGWRDTSFPYLSAAKPRTVYYWSGHEFEAAARFTNSLFKLVPTEWGPPTFEIDGIKMLPTARVSPFEDARQKVGLVEPRGKVVLDTCGGLGYFASWCLRGDAARVLSFEKSPDVIWLRGLNPWSPSTDERLTLTRGDVVAAITTLPSRSVDAVLHDPPRFGIAGELYAQSFYDQLARVTKSGGKLFHYTGRPNKLTTGRDVPKEVAKRLQTSGFRTKLLGDGVFATKVRE